MKSCCAARRLIGLFCLGVMLMPPVSWAQSGIAVTNAWARATVPAQRVGGVYMEIRSAAPARLLSVSSLVAARAEIHGMKMEGGVMKMFPVDGIDLPAGKMHHSDQTADTTVTIGGRPVATAIGPAAGPHTQLAQNIVAGWLAGARVFELKTVQVRDDLEIPRPCIDVEGVGYNVEWSQELRIAQSLEEYVKAAMALQVLGGWEALRPVIGSPGPHLFDMSVGYDLAGIQSGAMAGFISGLLDASEVINRLRPEIPDPFAAWRDFAFPTRVVGGVTLSTFHGCPPDEIEAIARHLMTEYGLDVVVKLNPTLLGVDAVGAILRRLLLLRAAGEHEQQGRDDEQRRPRRPAHGTKRSAVTTMSTRPCWRSSARGIPPCSILSRQPPGAGNSPSARRAGCRCRACPVRCPADWLSS